MILCVEPNDIFYYQVYTQLFTEIAWSIEILPTDTGFLLLLYQFLHQCENAHDYKPQILLASKWQWNQSNMGFLNTYKYHLDIILMI